jgi:hypothetical protein
VGELLEDCSHSSQGELDRIVDYSVALEAVLMWETHFVNRMLKRRATALLSVPEDKAAEFSKLIGSFYGYRSTIAHGEPLKEKALADIHGRMDFFELVVRAVLLQGRPRNSKMKTFAPEC